MAGLLSGTDAERLAAAGRHGDTMLAHINPHEAALLRAQGGAGTINPHTGLPEFYAEGRSGTNTGSERGNNGERGNTGGGSGSERGGSTSSKSSTTKASPAAAAAAAAGRQDEYSAATASKRDSDAVSAAQKAQDAKVAAAKAAAAKAAADTAARKQYADSMKQAGLQNLAGVGSKEYAGSLAVAKEGKSTLETLFDRLLPVDITPQYDALKNKRYTTVDLDLGELAGSAVGLVAGPLAGLAAGALLDNNLGKVALNGAAPATGTGTGTSSGSSGGGGNGGENGGSSIAYQGTSGSGTTGSGTSGGTTTTAAPGGLLTGISGPSGGMTPAERFARDFYNGGKAGTATPQSFGEVTKWQG